MTASRARGKSNPIIIAMDGPAGSGKSTTARLVAERLKLPYLDTGAMFRAVTLLAIERKVPLTDDKRLASIAATIPLKFGKLVKGKQKVWCGRRDVSKAIRLPELTQQVHFAASSGPVRAELLKLQRRIAMAGGGVIEGRDIGTVVFPDASYKFYLDADIRLRARRRFKELTASGVKTTFTAILKDQKLRDHRDANRKVAPLRKAKDAILIDTTGLTIPETADIIQDLIFKARPRPKSGRRRT
jgi:cytidylate kinase